MIIKKIESAERFFERLDNNPEDWERHTIAFCNWPDEYPYAPDAGFAIAHTGDTICIRFYVDEEYTMAMVTEDNGEVWTDSCVEFFINFDDSGYYNFEFNCIGTILLGFRKEKVDAVHAGGEILGRIRRSSTLGKKPFTEAESKSVGHWELSVRIPAGAFFRHDIKSFDGVTARANFYKCGDNLSHPHFLSWNPINNPAPDFHLEEFFGGIGFAAE